MKVVAIDSAVVRDHGWDMKVPDLFAVFVSNDVAKTTTVHPLRTIFGVPHYFVDEVSQMEHEAQLISLLRGHIFKDHSAICILRALIGVLTTDKGKPHGPVVAANWSRDGPSQTAAIATLISKAVPVDSGRLQPASQDAAGPV